MPFNRAAAKQAGYTDEEIDTYLASKSATPTTQPARPTVSSTPVAQPKKEGFISRLIKPTTEAFGGTARNIATLGQVGTSALLSPFAPQKAAQIAGLQGGMFLTQDELEELEDNPKEALKKQAKRSAIIASYAIPVSRTTTAFGQQIGLSAFKGGALAGGLYGVGQEDATPESIATSALLGGAFAWGLSKVFPGAKGKGEKLQEKVVGKQPRNLKQIVKQEGITKKAKDLGMPTGAAQTKLDWATRKYTSLWEPLDDAINKIDDTFDGTKLASDSIDKAKLLTDLDAGAGKSAASFWADQMANIKNAKDLARLKFQMQSAMSRGGSQSPGNLATKAFHETIDDALKGASKEVAKILDDMSTLHAVVGSNTAGRGGGLLFSAGRPDISVFPLVPGVRIPGSRGAIQATQDVAGKALEAGGSALKGDVAASIGARAPQFLQALSGQQLERAEPVSSLDDYNNRIKEIADRKADIPETKEAISKEQVIAVLMSPDIKSTTKTAIVTAYKLQSGGLSAADKRKVGEAQDALVLLDLIEKNYTELYNLGLTAGEPGLIERASGFVRGKGAAVKGDPAALAYDNTKKAFTRKLARAAGEKGVLTDQDVNDFADSLPSFDTNPEAAMRQLQYLRDIISGSIEDYVETQAEDIDLDTL